MKTITQPNIEQKIHNREAFAFLDVSSPAAYERGHLPGTLNVPLNDQFEAAALRLIPDRDAEIVVCEGSTPGSRCAYAAAKILEELGYHRVQQYVEPSSSDANNTSN